jgi:[protein-PII] uridylyltransferase
MKEADFQSRLGMVPAAAPMKKVITTQHISPAGVSSEEIAAHFNLLPERYFAQTDEADVARHLAMVNQLLHTISAADSLGSLRPVIDWAENPTRGCSIVHVVTWDRAGLFYKLAGALGVAGLNILSALITTRNDHIAIDRFEVTGPDGGPVREARARDVFSRAVEDALVGNRDLAPAIAEQAQQFAAQKLAPHAPVVEVYLEISSPRVILEIHAADRFGLLYRVGRVISEHGFSLAAARVHTERGVAIDRFHLESADRDPVDVARLQRLRDALLGAAE